MATSASPRSSRAREIVNRGPHRILSAVAVVIAAIPLLLSVTLLLGG